MDVSVIIPTYDRPDLLKNTIASLRRSSHPVSIVVVVDGNRDLVEPVRRMKVDTMIVNDERRDWIYSMNLALSQIDDGGVVYASDDLIFAHDCIRAAVTKLTTKAPNTDAMVAIEQDVKGCSTAFGLLGRKFISRFPDNKVFCPDYVHWCSDMELGKFARSIGRLYTCPGAKVTHTRRKDRTHRIAKAIERRDFTCRDMRLAKGLLWGRSFEMVTVGGGKWMK